MRNNKESFYNKLEEKYKEMSKDGIYSDLREKFIIGYCSLALDLNIINHEEYHDCMVEMTNKFKLYN